MFTLHDYLPSLNGWKVRVLSDLHFAYACILPPLLARGAVPLLFAHTHYVRAQGVGADLAQYQSRPGAGGPPHSRRSPGNCVGAMIEVSEALSLVTLASS